jgi:hypothetical protein
MLDVQKYWMEDQIRRRDEAGPKPTAFNTPFRVSDSGACIRKRTLSAFDAMESDEFSSQTYMAFEIGNAVHKSIQDALDCDGNGWYFEAEVPIDLSEVTKKVGHGIESFGLSGHCDGIITQNGSGIQTIVEIKTVSGYAAKLAWPYPGNDAGPKREHVAQATLYALGVEAESIMIVYVAKEGDYRSGIKAGDIMQWDFHLHETTEWWNGQTPYDIAMDELRHFQYASRFYAKGQVAPAFVPDDDGELKLIIDRPEYMQKGGKPWQCVYCNYSTMCRSLSEDEVPVKMIERSKRVAT